MDAIYGMLQYGCHERNVAVRMPCTECCIMDAMYGIDMARYKAEIQKIINFFRTAGRMIGILEYCMFKKVFLKLQEYGRIGHCTTWNILLVRTLNRMLTLIFYFIEI